MREFATAARLEEHAAEEAQAAADYDPVEMRVAGRDIAIDFPGDGQVIYMTMLMASNDPPLLRVGKLINFVVSLLSQDDRRFIENLLLTKGSGFGGDDIVQIVEYLIEEWTGNPTDEPSGSSRTRSSGTPRSTAASRRAGARQRSASTSPASAT